jgi:hypothetical protein
MKNKTAAILLVIGLLAASSAAYAQVTGIAATKHNLSSSGTQAIKGQTAEICIYCHTPHGGQKAIQDDTGPLWNRNYTPGTFQVYASYTLDATPSNPPTSVSKACLSCHDGTLGLNQLLNNAGPGSGTNPATDPNPIGGASGTNNMALIGTDLRDDHPVSMIYGDAKSYGTGAAIGTDSHAAGFRGATTIGTRPVVQNGSITLPLYGTSTANGKVECGSCHDPHEERSKTGASDPAKSVYFLRVANDNSQLCLACHLK